MSIIIKNKNQVNTIITNFIQGCPDKIHILADFDKTITKGTINGNDAPSIIAILRNENYLTPDYSQKAHRLAEIYSKIEHDPTIALTKRKESMNKWWAKHFKLLIQSGLNKKDIDQAVRSENIQLRIEAAEVIKKLQQNSIPLIIISAIGIGTEAISAYLKLKLQSLDGIYIISNDFNWNENGEAVSHKDPIIHSLNKDETTLQNFPYIANEIKDRKNVILLGDNISDTAMITGYNYNNLLKIGFLNKKIEENIAGFSKSYDVVITNDGPMTYLNDLLDKIL